MFSSYGRKPLRLRREKFVETNLEVVAAQSAAQLHQAGVLVAKVFLEAQLHRVKADMELDCKTSGQIPVRRCTFL